MNKIPEDSLYHVFPFRWDFLNSWFRDFFFGILALVKAFVHCKHYILARVAPLNISLAAFSKGKHLRKSRVIIANCTRVTLNCVHAEFCIVLFLCENIFCGISMWKLSSRSSEVFLDINPLTAHWVQETRSNFELMCRLTIVFKRQCQCHLL